MPGDNATGIDLRVLFIRIDADFDQEMLCHKRVGSWMMVNT